MSYHQCPHCRANNRATDSDCYNCHQAIGELPKEPESSATATEITPAEIAHSMAQAVLAIGIATVFGGALGFTWDRIPMDLPFALEQITLGTICATGTAFLIGKFQDMPHWKLNKRLWPAAMFGAIVGLCLYAVWWSFDPAVGGLGIGLCAGFCAGLPVVISFGLAGGESRPMGKLEFLNLGVSLLMGVVVAFIFVLEDDPANFPGVLGLCGLLPTLAGNRINLVEVVAYINSFDSSRGSGIP